MIKVGDIVKVVNGRNAGVPNGTRGVVTSLVSAQSCVVDIGPIGGIKNYSMLLYCREIEHVAPLEALAYVYDH